MKRFPEWNVGRCPLWAKLSKSLHCSQVPDLSLNGLKPEFEHFLVRRVARGQHLGLGLGQGQFEPVFTSLPVAFLFRKRRSEGLHTLRLFLLRLDRFAFEAPRHASLTLAENVPELIRSAGLSPGGRPPHAPLYSRDPPVIIAFLLLVQVTAETVATCRVPNDPQQRVWALERLPSSWRIAFSSKALDRPRVELPVMLPPHPTDSSSPITLVYASANGGKRIEWTITNGPSTLDLLINHGLEVNVERDLDPAVELMNTDGPLALVCSTSVPRAFDARSTVERRASEWNVGAGAARSVRLFESTSGRAYAVQTIGYSRELTRELKFIGIRGRFAWGVEAMPVFAQFSPSTIYGVGFAPVVWRWNFPPGSKWSAFGELSMGGMWTTDAIPEQTSRGNFTAHWGGGARRRLRGNNALLLAYRFQHFSNGNQLGSNPGVNSHVFLAGWSHRS